MCVMLNIGLISICAFLIIKIFQKFYWVSNNSHTCLVGKTAIVTGANSGIGYFIAQDFAKRGARVILACRNEANAKATVLKLIEETSNPNILTATLDLSSLESVRKFVQHIKSTEAKLHILVNNAGAIYLDNAGTTKDITNVKQVNYLGPFLLTVLLLDLLKKSAPSRIMSSASILAHTVSVDGNCFNRHPSQFSDYGQSKLLNLMFMNELAQRLKGSGIVANTVNPGETHTTITKNFPSIIRIPGKYFTKAFFKSAEQGAQTAIHVAVSKDTANVTGKYFDNCSEARFPSMPTTANDKELRKNIFERSLQLAKIKPDELAQLNNLFKTCKGSEK